LAGVTTANRAIDRLLIVFACAAVGLFLFVAIRYSGQTLLEAHAFRQTQTALTTYWFLQNGFSLAYETPVAGYPWTIPLELPLFQGVVAALTSWFGGNLDANGRIVSAAFLLACILPLGSIVRQLGLNRRVWLILIVLMFTGPSYLFWGRAFLIETAALLFSLTYLVLLLAIVRHRDPSVAVVCLATVAGVLAGTQKATLGLPVLALSGALFAWTHWRGAHPTTVRRAASFVAVVIVPIAVTFLWNAYADSFKAENPIAAQRLLTDAPEARLWNFGTLEQRLQPRTWKVILWNRGLHYNAAGVIGAALIAGVLVRPMWSRLRALVAAALLLWITPAIIFTNLFHVHDYYQVELAVFLLFALAIAIGEWVPRVVRQQWAIPILVVFCAGWSLRQFSVHELPRMTGDFNRNVLILADAVRQRTPPDSPIVVYGMDWSSELPYYAQRRAIAVPPWFNGWQAVWAEPERFLGGVTPSAIVICRGEGIPSEAQVADRMAKDRSLMQADAGGCRILYRSTSGANTGSLPQPIVAAAEILLQPAVERYE
jgi:hypothetical protein